MRVLFYYRGIAYERAKDWAPAEKDFLKALERQRPAGREQRRFHYVLDLVFIHCIGRPWHLGERVPR